MGTNLTGDLYVITKRYGNIDEDSTQAWLSIDCPFCQGTQATTIAVHIRAFREPTGCLGPLRQLHAWLRAQQR